MLLLWSEFLLCSVIIVYAGTNLSRYGDVIAEKTSTVPASVDAVNGMLAPVREFAEGI